MAGGHVTNEHVKKIIKKLKAKQDPDRPPNHHIYYVVEYNGAPIARFGKSSTSKKGKSQNHLPSQLHLNQHDTVKMAQCSISREEWIERLIEDEIISEEEIDELTQEE